MIKSLSILTLVMLLSSTVSVFGADNVVVIPLQTCGDALTKCSGKCVDTMYNPNFCGDCTTICEPGTFCFQGICKAQAGASCSTHRECLSGKCTTLGTCVTPSKFVFISSIGYTGALGGVASADNICQGLATNAGLPGEYKAWLSDGSISPSTSFKQSAFPYILVNGVKIAEDWNDLIDGTFLYPIHVTEIGTFAPSNVWTNTKPDGTSYFANYDYICDFWTSASHAFQAVTGYSIYTDDQWTVYEGGFCDALYRIYCIEQ